MGRDARDQGISIRNNQLSLPMLVRTSRASVQQPVWEEHGNRQENIPLSIIERYLNEEEPISEGQVRAPNDIHVDQSSETESGEEIMQILSEDNLDTIPINLVNPATNIAERFSGRP